MKEQIAKELAGSGLFEWVESSTSILEIRFGGLPWPTADESEEILEHRGFEVIRRYDKWYLVGDDMNTDYDGFLVDCDEPLEVGEKPSRSLVNNAGLLRWYRDEREDLERTLKEMGKL